jgi:hypothetical protein
MEHEQIGRHLARFAPANFFPEFFFVDLNEFVEHFISYAHMRQNSSSCSGKWPAGGMPG